MRRIYLSIAGGISGLLLAAIAVLSVLSVRLAYRQYEADGIQQAYRMATEGTSDGFYILTAVRKASGAIVDFIVVDCNEAGAGFVGARPEQLIGRRLTHHRDTTYFRWMIQTCASAMDAGHSDEEVQLPPGNPMRLNWVRRRLVRCGDGLAVTLQDIGQRKLHEQDLLRLGNEDALTGLPNRHWLGRYLPPAIDRANARGGMLALLAVDLDSFKEINDTHGHADGDEMLRSAARRLGTVLRPTDRLVHLGGDEFAVLLMPVEREAKIVLTARQIAELFDEPFKLATGTRKMGVSVGISLFPRDGGDTATLLKNADIAMQAVKMSGKGHCRFYKPELYETIRKRRRIEQELGEALTSDQLVVYYQPRADTQTGKLCSMEALVRWVHPQRGMVLPLEFIPVAESTGLISVLGDFVIEKVCAQIAIWTAAGLPVVPVSINVSAHQFERGDLPRVLAASMALHDVDARLVEVELTESAMMGDHRTVVEQLGAIRAQGVKLLVDDFGTGYSSLAQLQRFEMDGLKIDRAFTSELGQSAQGEVFLRAILSMAHALGMSVVAEGVETREQLDILRSLDCNEVQGYLIAKPVTAAQMGSMMEQGTLVRLYDDFPAIQFG
jgi:diguanylate cyclase (GGDEF)-like protein